MTATTSPGPLNVDRSDPLNETLGTRVWIRWQTLVFVAIFIAAVFTRLYGLGDRAMSHDESLHVFYSYNLYMKGDFDHTPLMHGPIMFHVNALMYALFGDNDFTGRLYAALLGIGMVMTPLLFRRWLGKWGTILASLMILISPLLMYYNRYIREDTPAIMASILMAWAAITYISGPPEERRKPRYLYILSAAMLWNLGSKETAFFYIAIFGLFLTMYWLFRIAQSRWGIAARQWFNALMMSILLGAVIAIGMYNILDITPLSAVTSGAQIEGWLQNIDLRSFILWTVRVVHYRRRSDDRDDIALGVLGRGSSRVPWREFIMMTAAALLVTLVFIVIEERSHLTREDLGIAQPFDPNAEEQGTQMAGAISWLPILAPWALMFVSTGIFVVSRRKNAEGKDWWDWLNQFPELDVLWIMGTLVLPWITAIFIVAARGSPEEYARLGTSFGSWAASFQPDDAGLPLAEFCGGFPVLASPFDYQHGCRRDVELAALSGVLADLPRHFCLLLHHGLHQHSGLCDRHDLQPAILARTAGRAARKPASVLLHADRPADVRVSADHRRCRRPRRQFHLCWTGRRPRPGAEAEAGSSRKQKNLIRWRSSRRRAKQHRRAEPAALRRFYEEPAAVALRATSPILTLRTTPAIRPN